MRPPVDSTGFTAVVLAGGENRRFGGKIKALHELDGKPIIERVTGVLEQIFSDILVVTNTPDHFEYLGYPMVQDHFKKVGPLGGLHAAMKSSRAESLFVVAGDMPWLSGEIIAMMINSYRESDCEVLIPTCSGLDEPLHAIYSRALLGRLENFLVSTRRYAIKEFLNLAKVQYLVVEDCSGSGSPFANINRPDDLQKHSRQGQHPAGRNELT
ncbi:MAG: molybdenum cofactor guanylyltransferase [Bacteroidales bacterium]